MLNECEQLWASRAAQARLTNHVVAPSVNPALEMLGQWVSGYKDEPFRNLHHFATQ